MRCPDCNKFVPFDTETDPEVNAEASGGSVSVTARIVNTCGECGTELKEANFSLDVGADEIAEHYEKSKGCANKDDLTVEVENESRIERSTAAKSPRYSKRFYGFEADVIINCNTCDEQITSIHVNDEIQASGMDELV